MQNAKFRVLRTAIKNLFFIILSCFITSAVFAQRECGAIFPTDEEYEAMPKANLIEIAKYSKKKQNNDSVNMDFTALKNVINKAKEILK